MILPIAIPENGKGYNLQHMVSFKQHDGDITVKWSDGTSQTFTGQAARDLGSRTTQRSKAGYLLAAILTIPPLILLLLLIFAR